MSTKLNPSHIAELAYQLYLEDGKPEGQALDHWLRAANLLSHPENYSDQNILAVPSEPELTRNLQEKGAILDQNLPSDPHTGPEALHQCVDVAVAGKQKLEEVKAIKRALKRLKGVERLEPDLKSGLVSIYFDTRQTNPAAIHEAIESVHQSAGKK